MKKQLYIFGAASWLLLSAAYAADNDFNPQISLILDGKYSDYSLNPEDYVIPGFQLGGEAGLSSEGFALGHSELRLSSNIDPLFYGEATLAIAEHEGETEVEIEEAFIQTLGLGNGFTLKFGRFLSAFGYLNAHHPHAWDFADAPLVYSAMLGNYLADDGIQISYLAATEVFMEFTVELLSGNAFPAGGNENGGIGASLFAFNTGGDIGVSHAWQLGLSHWRANDILGRTSDAHAHGGVTEIPSFDGDSRINAVDFVYKWAPEGNASVNNFKLIMEYLDRSEDGQLTLLNSGPPEETSTYIGDQSGWYVQAVYQFQPRWRFGLRFDQLKSDNTGSDITVLDEASLIASEDPQRSSLMLEWLPSEYSRIRLQYNQDDTRAETDQQIYVQYTMSLGAHGAHQF